MKLRTLNCNFAPTDVAVGSARSCYYGKSIVTPQEVQNWDKKNELLNSIFKAGHHTTLMHYHFTFLIEGVSRHLIWRFLHAHPFYNSEQVSQRYAKMRIENFKIPKNADRKKWEEYYKKMFSFYEELIVLLQNPIKEVLPKFKLKETNKKAQEFARYVLPVGMKAHLYHTINIITALRYINAQKALPECREEGEEFVNLMIEEMLKTDKNLAPLIEFAKEEEVVFPNIDIKAIKTEHNVKKDVEVFDIIDYDFDLNVNYAGVLRSSNIYLDEAILGGFNSYVKLSLSADAQNQRHRRSPAIRAKLEDMYARDYYTPPIIAQNEKTAGLYKRAIECSYEFFEKQKDVLGFGESVYALTNAHNIQIIERNDFQEFAHKAQMRLCYNAQEEIFDIIYKQVKALREAGVKAADKFLPPCALRYRQNLRPVCPEGERFCGVKVWKLDFDEYTRLI